MSISDDYFRRLKEENAYFVDLYLEFEDKYLPKKKLEDYQPEDDKIMAEIFPLLLRVFKKMFMLGQALAKPVPWWIKLKLWFTGQKLIDNINYLAVTNFCYRQRNHNALILLTQMFIAKAIDKNVLKEIDFSDSEAGLIVKIALGLQKENRLIDFL